MSLAPFRATIQEASRTYNIPAGLLERQIMAESGGNPGARSPVGAVGMMQLMPATARGLGVNPLDPRQNIMGGAHYLAEQYQKFGSWDKALAAYNAGPGAVVKYGGVPPFPETKAYVSKILGGGLPNVGAAPQESPPVLAASAGMGASAPTALQAPAAPNFLQMAKQFASSAMGSVNNLNDVSSISSHIPSIDPDPMHELTQLTHNTQFSPLLRSLAPRFSADIGGGNQITQVAKSYLGVPYKWGGTSRQGGMDCSGFLQNVMKDAGIKIGRTTYEQVNQGQPVSLKQLQPGDAVFTEPGHAGPNHVGLYVGHGMIQESPHTGTVNSYIPLKNYLGGGFVAARRYTGMLPQPKGGKK